MAHTMRNLSPMQKSKFDKMTNCPLGCVGILKGHEDQVWSIGWSPLQPVLATCSSDRSIRVFRLNNYPSSSKEKLNWDSIGLIDDAHKRTVRSIRFSPSGKLLASASFDGNTAIWEKFSGQDEYECVATLEGHENEVKAISWSASGSLLATCGRDKSVWIWEVIDDSDFECISVLQEHAQDVKMVVWHPTDDILASASYDDTIKIWKEDDDDWYCSDTLLGHTSTVWACDFSPKGDKLVSVSDDKSLRLWTSETPPSGPLRKDPKWTQKSVLADYHSRSIYSVSWSKVHGYIATVGGDNTLRITQEMEGKLVPVAEVKLEDSDGDLNCVSWCPLESHGFLLATGGDDGLVRIWRFHPGSEQALE